MINRQTKGQGSKKKPSISSLIVLIALGIAFYFGAGGMGGRAADPVSTPEVIQSAVHNPGEKDSVHAYLQEHGELPHYYISKAQARELGWQGGSLEPYAPGKMIGGDSFVNFEGLLPKKSGRIWTEADIGTMGKPGRGAERIVFSNDGLIYYTPDHYESFEKLGEVD